jgi:hypothetical protein
MNKPEKQQYDKALPTELFDIFQDLTWADKINKQEK